MVLWYNFENYFTFKIYYVNVIASLSEFKNCSDLFYFFFNVVNCFNKSNDCFNLCIKLFEKLIIKSESDSTVESVL